MCRFSIQPSVQGTFLSESISFIHKKFADQKQLGQWPAYVVNDLLPRIYGFELMMAPYTIAHLKLEMALEEMQVTDFHGGRLGIYLTNTLEPGIPAPPDLLSLIGVTEAISEESRLASSVKNERPLLVLIGNPPYKGESHNNTDYARGLVENYGYEPGTKSRLKEANSKWINDDYVKFLAFAEREVVKNGSGVVAMITGNGYLHNPTFRGMRYNLLQSFDKIYLLNLHGSVQKREKTPDGKLDSNVFDISVGVSIVIAVKTTNSTGLARVFYGDLYGTRSHKFKALDSEKELWSEIDIDSKFYRFAEAAPQDIRDEYYSFVSIKELFPMHSLGVITKRDKLSIGFTSDGLKLQLKEFFDSSITTDEACRKFGLKVVDRDRWDAESLRENYSADEAIKNIRDIIYRPFDSRKIAYDQQLVARLNTKVLSHIEDGNYGIVVGRQGQAVKDVMWNLVFAVDEISDQNIFGRGGGTVMPLNVRHLDGSWVSNVGSDAAVRLKANLEEKDIPHSSVFDYVYGVLHSPAYRTKYADFLRTDFPQIPPPLNDNQFNFFRSRGQKLRELHLSGTELDPITTYPVNGEHSVDFYKFQDGKVWINETQYFGEVPLRAWTHYIGGYQPAQKWLKDRKGRKLTNDEISSYQSMIRIMADTVETMDDLENYGAWWV